MTIATFLDPKWPVCPEEFLEKQYGFHEPIDPFHCAKFLKNC